MATHATLPVKAEIQSKAWPLFRKSHYPPAFRTGMLVPLAGAWLHPEWRPDGGAGCETGVGGASGRM